MGDASDGHERSETAGFKKESKGQKSQGDKKILYST